MIVLQLRILIPQDFKIIRLIHFHSNIQLHLQVDINEINKIKQLKDVFFELH